MGLLMDNLTNNNEFTLKDLLNMYLREIENAQANIEKLENRINRDIDTINIDIRQYKSSNDDDLRDINNEIKEIKLIIHNMSKDITSLINTIEKESISKDHQHDLDIADLKRQSMISGGGSGILVTTAFQLLLEYLKLPK